MTVRELLAAIREHRAEFEAAGVLAEDMRTLPPATVATLRSLGLFWLKTPAEFGGWLPDEGARRVFGGGQAAGVGGSLPLIAGQPQPRGAGRRVPGGYVVSGRWGFASGIVHAGWVIGGFPAPGDPGVVKVFLAPKDDAEVIDTWHVA